MSMYKLKEKKKTKGRKKLLLVLTLLLISIGIVSYGIYKTVTPNKSIEEVKVHHVEEIHDKVEEKEKKEVSKNVDIQDVTGVTVIGDSVIVGVAPYLEELLPGILVDGKVGRQMIQAEETVKQLQTEGKLGGKIIIELGTNGLFNSNQLRNLLSLLSDKQIFIVNTRVPREWENTVNNTISEVAPEFKNTTIIDWYVASEGKENYFYQDGIHLKPEGAKFYASLILKAIKENN
ncbi:SGNH/GDSL hydrolase family protein [Viridibacillus arvi]|uniref:SGNH/GDSL hydrolase family protein n=1 Tax=Viridibacillus arvi TaxID=263475 RepID=UPI003D2D94DB